MRTILFLFIALLTTAFSLKVEAQAKKYVLCEHFTNAGCGPCAAQNPIFDTAIIKKNHGKVHQITYHTNWPGSDPMNAYNATDVQSRVTYYGVSGVPDIELSGNQFSGIPLGVTQKMIDNIASHCSPVRILVKQTPNGSSRDVRIVVHSLLSTPPANYVIRAAVIEKEINYTTAPGSNGEKHFPDVFRKLLPNAGGDPFTPAPAGDSVVFNYSYSLDITNWDTSKIYIVAFIQNTVTKEILNSGSNIDPQWEAVPVSKSFLGTSKNSTKVFHFNLYNLSDSASDFLVKLESDMPAGWNSYFEINSNQSNDSLQVSLPPHAQVSFSLTVETDNEHAISSHTLFIKCLNDTFQGQVLHSHIMQGITDLVINNDSPWGDGNPSRSEEFQKYFAYGLEASGNNAFSIIPLATYLKGIEDTVLNDCKYIYFNVGWSFPGLSDENVNVFRTLLDNGGRLMISGQDVGWDTWDLTNGGNGTTITQNFYTNYLNATWVNDGGSTNNNLIANTGDVIFGQTSSSAVVNPYGSGNNGPFFYPDQINARGNGIPIFYYNNTSSIAAVRSTNGTYRTVYLGFSLEQLQDSLVKIQIMELTHDWFHNIITGIEFDKAINELTVGQSIPNPADGYAFIPVENLQTESVLYLFNIRGEKIYECLVPEGQDKMLLNTVNLDNGTYFYVIHHGKNRSNIRKLNVIH